MRFCIVLIISFFINSAGIFAQRDVEKEPMGVSMIDFNYTFQIPGGDMAKRFGVNSSIGGGYTYKTVKNWLFGFELNYMFGQNIKDVDSLLWDLEVHPGDFIISGEGSETQIRIHERGMNGFVKFGKLFPVLSPNPNSGFFVTGGIGAMGYKIKIDNVSGDAPMFAGKNNDYLKGYDRYTTGFAITESVGYLYLSNKRMLNFYVAADFVQGFTKNRREYEFDKMEFSDDKTRNDLLYGIRVGWIFSIYQRPPKEFYYE